MLVGLSIVPHGTMILDPSLTCLLPDAQNLHNATSNASEDCLLTKPDIIVLLSPHSLSLSTSLTISSNSSLSGTALWNGRWGDFCVDCEVESVGVNDICKAFDKFGLTVEGITSFASGCSSPIAWGEVVPLWFHKQLLQTGTKVILLGLPQTRHSAYIYTDEATIIGKAMHEFATTSASRVHLMFSCDLSHVHSVSDSTPSIFLSSVDLGTNEVVATTFDNSVQEWAKQLFEKGEVNSAHDILHGVLKENVMEARVCGWAGICAIQSCMEEVANIVNSSNRNDILGWTGKVYGYAAPSYFGMIVAALTLSN